jgi:hypothetical protein
MKRRKILAQRHGERREEILAPGRQSVAMGVNPWNKKRATLVPAHGSVFRSSKSEEKTINYLLLTTNCFRRKQIEYFAKRKEKLIQKNCKNF